MISLSLPRSRNTCGWSNGGLAPTHMNSCDPISITETPASLWKCGTTWSDISFTLDGNDDGCNRRDAALRNAAHHTGGYRRFQVAPAAHLLMQIRHNLVFPEKPFFRRGRCVLNAAHYFEVTACEVLRDETGLAWFGGGRHGGKRRRGRSVVAARPRSLRHSGGSGRACPIGRSPAQFCAAEQAGVDRGQHRGGAGRRR